MELAAQPFECQLIGDESLSKRPMNRVAQPLSAMGRRGEISIDDVLNSKMIAEPLHLLDSCIVNQGAGCVVVAAEELIDHRRPKVRVVGYGQAHGYLDPCSAPSLTTFAGVALSNIG